MELVRIFPSRVQGKIILNLGGGLLKNGVVLLNFDEQLKTQVYIWRRDYS